VFVLKFGLACFNLRVVWLQSGLDFEGIVVLSQARVWDFLSLLHSVQIRSGAHPALYWTGAEGSYPPGCDANYLPPSSAEVGLYLHPHQMSSWHCAGKTLLHVTFLCLVLIRYIPRPCITWLRCWCSGQHPSRMTAVSGSVQTHSVLSVFIVWVQYSIITPAVILEMCLRPRFIGGSYEHKVNCLLLILRCSDNVPWRWNISICVTVNVRVHFSAIQIVNVKSVKLKMFVVVVVAVVAHYLTVRLCRLNSLDLLMWSSFEGMWRSWSLAAGFITWQTKVNSSVSVSSLFASHMNKPRSLMVREYVRQVPRIMWLYIVRQRKQVSLSSSVIILTLQRTFLHFPPVVCLFGSHECWQWRRALRDGWPMSLTVEANVMVGRECEAWKSIHINHRTRFHVLGIYGGFCVQRAVKGSYLEPFPSFLSCVD